MQTTEERLLTKQDYRPTSKTYHQQIGDIKNNIVTNSLEQKKKSIQNVVRAYHNAIWHECLLTIASLTGLGITVLPMICKSSWAKKYKNLLYTGQSIVFLLSLWGMTLRPAAYKDSIFWRKQLTEKVNEYAQIVQKYSSNYL